MLKLICTLMLCTGFAFAADVSGAWQLTVETSQGSGNPTVVFQQQGEQLTGTFNSQIFGEARITGSVKGNAIEFGFEGDAGGQKMKVSYKGTIESPTVMKGTAVYAGSTTRPPGPRQEMSRCDSRGGEQRHQPPWPHHGRTRRLCIRISEAPAMT